MDIYGIKCKNCGKKLLTYSDGSFRKYKSPVKICKKCGTRYVDPRCHEIAIEGIPPDTFSLPSYLFLMIVGGLILYRGIYLFGGHQLGVSNEIQWLLPFTFVIMGTMMVIIGIVEIISIISGIKAKKFETLRKESEERLKDKSYVYVLQKFGYEIPEKYL